MTKEKMPKENVPKTNQSSSSSSSSSSSPSIMDGVSNFFAGLWQQANNAGKSIRHELQQNSFGKETVTVLDELAEGVSNFGMGTINFIRSGIHSEAMKNIGKGAALMGEGLFQGAKGVTTECVHLGTQAGKAIDKGIHSQTVKNMEAGAVAFGREAVIVGGEAAKMVGRGAVAVGHGAVKVGEEGARLVTKGAAYAGEGAVFLGHESVAMGKVVGKAIDTTAHSETVKHIEKNTLDAVSGVAKAAVHAGEASAKAAVHAGEASAKAIDQHIKVKIVEK